MKLIDKDALVAEIIRRRKAIPKEEEDKRLKAVYGNEAFVLAELLEYIDTLEVKEVGISIPNIDDTLKEEGLDPDSKEAKVFKEGYYMALEKLKAQKGE